MKPLPAQIAAVARPALRPLTLLLAAFLALALIEYRLHLLQPIDSRLSDLFIRAQAAKHAPDPDIVIVDIDDASLARMADLADRWPWPRSVHGEVAAGLVEQGARAVVFDVIFAEPDRWRPESDRLFNDLVRPLGNVYFSTVRFDPAGDPYGVRLRDVAKALGMLYPRDAAAEARANLMLPLALTPDNWRLGAINLLADPDGVARRYYLYLPASGWKIPSLPARVANDLGYLPPQQESIVLGWSAPTRKRVSFADLYEDFGREKRQRPHGEFKGKIVIVGTAATGMGDLRATPMGEFHPGVDIIATALDNLKNRDYMRVAPGALPLALTFTALLAIFFAYRRGTNTLAIGGGVAVLMVLLLLASYAAIGQRYLLPVLTPIAFAAAFYFACALHGYLYERRERLRAVDYFSRFVNPHVVRDLLEHGGLQKSGESREITVLFSDIRGFTTLSEQREPVEVVALLNRYFSRQVEVIFRHGGTLDKFIGDAIMAFWGAPLDDPDHARHAVMAAIEMGETLEQFKRELGPRDAAFDVGIGLSSGAAVVGLIGSENKREYTAIGDTVNLGSRIEGLTKGVARVLVSEETMRRCGDAFRFVERGAFKVRGREQEVRLYEPSRKRS